MRGYVRMRSSGEEAGVLRAPPPLVRLVAIIYRPCGAYLESIIRRFIGTATMALLALPVYS